MRTKEKLAKALRDNGLEDMAHKADQGAYDDFESPSATPIVDLVFDLLALGRRDLANRAKHGEWDGTREEAEEWYRKEGFLLMRGKK